MAEVVGIHQQTTPSYSWAEGCQAWILNNTETATIKEELMAPGTREQLHLHKAMEQFFYILEGVAVIVLEGRTFQLNAGQGLHIVANTAHFIENKSGASLRFLVISTPGENTVPEKRRLLNS